MKVQRKPLLTFSKKLRDWGTELYGLKVELPQIL